MAYRPKGQRRRTKITEAVKRLYKMACKYQGKHDPMRYNAAMEGLIDALDCYLDREMDTATVGTGG